ncbi:7S RNA binding protein [Aureococcus anophagefferens]|nr:7S RNA binding protein [Aureococcus anophagefferens]
MARRAATAALVLAAAWAFAPPQTKRATTQLYFFDKLAESITAATDVLSGKSRMTEANTKSALRDVRRSLLDADVAKVVVDGFVENVQASALDGEVAEGVDPGQQFVKIVYDELKRVMGGDDDELLFSDDPEAAAKARAGLAYRDDGAPTLQILGEQVGVPVYAEAFEAGAGDAVAIATAGVRAAKERGADVVIVDTAGRQVIEESLMAELRSVRAATKPDETLLVLDAMTGQDAASLAKRFDDACPLTGSVLTKLDGDARGGAALSVRAVSGKPIKFVGVGEKVGDLEPFFPARMASRILGMGDVVSLVEKASKQQSAAEAKAVMERTKQAKFNFDDYLDQARMVSNMGSFGAVAKMMPGMGGIDNDQIAAAEAKIKIQASLINSMTPKERGEPDLIIRDKSALARQKRIAAGSGRCAR